LYFATKVQIIFEKVYINMIKLNLPAFELKLRGTKEHPQIFDILRRKYIALTPEEWVRQHFIHYLVEHKGYPASLLANEIPLTIGDKTLRADSVLYSRELQPKMIIEYKAPHIPISQKVFDQITAYNMLLHVDYLVVSNGMEHYICKMDYAGKKYLFLEDIPNYDELEKEKMFPIFGNFPPKWTVVLKFAKYERVIF